jgi:hypothetical protein
MKEKKARSEDACCTPACGPDACGTSTEVLVKQEELLRGRRAGL